MTSPRFKAKSIATQQPDELQLQFAISRTGAVLTISSLVFLGVRRIEVTLIGVLGAMIFALPALRNALPGARPLSVRADILIFFWAELGA
ncbi:MAG: DUF4436 family protein, partial [Pseudolabrys sp.]